MATITSKTEEGDAIKGRALGHVQLRDRDTNEIILVPTPSTDPNDPLNWSQPYKYYIAGVICLAMLMCNFLAAGPSIAIVTTTMDFFPGVDPEKDPALFNVSVAKVAYFFTSTALMQGVGNFFWVPLANKYGRRPAYIFSYIIYTGCAIWLYFERSYNGFLAGRILMGFGAGAAETIAPITIADIFFLHERGTVMALYTSFLAVGANLGIVISGLITIHHHWRVIYLVASPLIGFVLLLAFFTFPETAYLRDQSQAPKPHLIPSANSSTKTPEISTTTTPIKRPYPQTLTLLHPALTHEPLSRLILRPLVLILLPPVLWAALVQAVTIGFLVAVSSNVDPAFHTAYGFSSWQVGLAFLAAVVGSLVGIPAAGPLADRVADRLTRRRGGVRDPEMRLPSMLLSLATTPLALVLFGLGVGGRWHWGWEVGGLGLLAFSIVQATNVCLVYVIDAYRPIAGEVTLAVMGFKSLFGFLLSFYTNTWVARAGYARAYGTMAGIAGCVLVLGVPLFVWGEKVRRVTWRWRVMAWVRWDDDREVGE